MNAADKTADETTDHGETFEKDATNLTKQINELTNQLDSELNA